MGTMQSLIDKMIKLHPQYAVDDRLPVAGQRARAGKRHRAGGDSGR